MPAGCRVVVLFFRCYLSHDRLRRFGTAKRMAIVRTDRRVDRHSNMRPLHGILVRYRQQKNSSPRGRKGATSTRVKRQSDLPAASNGELPEKQKWVEPVAAVLMARTTPSTATGVSLRAGSRLFRSRFTLETPS